MKKKHRKIANRTGKQKCPICSTQQILVEHHIEGRDIPNPNHSSNLAYICDNDHRKIHMGLIIIEGWFKTTDGLELFWHNSDDDSFTGKDAETYIMGQ